MATRVHPRSSARTPEATPDGATVTRSFRSWAVVFLLLGAVAAIVLAFYLSIFPARGFTTPIGWDSSEYLWRTRLAQDVGLAHLSDPLPSLATPKSGRPAYPVVVATLSSLGRVNVFRVAMVLPTVLALAIGLAGGAFVTSTLRRPAWELAAVAVAVSLSAVVVRLLMPEGYADTLFAAGVFLTAAIAAAFSVEDRSALVATIALLGAGAAIHWSFFMFVAAAIGLTALVYVPTSWRRWRSRETPLLDTPTARLAEGVIGGAATGGAILFGVLANGLPRPRIDLSEFVKKLHRDVPKYHFPFSLPAAAGGAAVLGTAGRRRDRAGARARFVLTFLLAWCAVVLAGYLARTVGHMALPAHRFLSFGLAIPILGIVAFLWVARLAARVLRRWIGRAAIVAGAAVVVLPLAANAAVSHVQWSIAKPFMEPARVEDAGLAEGYLEAAHVPDDRPVVFIMGTKDWNTIGLMGHTARAALPPERVRHLYIYVGSPAAYLARRPVDTTISRRYFGAVRPSYAANPVAIVLASYNAPYYRTWASAHPASVIRSRIAVVRGPAPPARVHAVAPPVGRVPAWVLGTLAVGSLSALALVGIGWSIALLGRWLRPVEVLAVTPAIGVAALVVFGIGVDRLGFRLVGAAGALTPLLAAVLGGAAALLTVRRRGRAWVVAEPGNGPVSTSR